MAEIFTDTLFLNLTKQFECLELDEAGSITAEGLHAVYKVRTNIIYVFQRIVGAYARVF